MQRIFIVHGIHTNDDAKWMFRFAEAFSRAGLDPQVWTYGYAYALTTRWENGGRAQALRDLILPGDIVLGHSNGGALIWLAAQLGAPIGGAVLLNPALDSDKALAEHVPWVNLYPNRHDIAVKFAKIFCKHPWGAQGRDGLSVYDPRYRTFFTDSAQPNVPAVFGHSSVLVSEPWLSHIISNVKERINEAK